MNGRTLIAQISTQPPPPSGITIDPSALTGLGGIGLIFWAGVQVVLKVWEKKATNQIATESVRSEANVNQEKQALSTLVEVFKRTSEATIELQGNAYKSNSELISQLSSIRANAAEVHYEGIKESMDRLTENYKDFNILFRQSTSSIVDLAEDVKRVGFILDTHIKEDERTDKDFINALTDISKTVNKIEQVIDRRISNASAPTI